MHTAAWYDVEQVRYWTAVVEVGELGPCFRSAFEPREASGCSSQALNIGVVWTCYKDHQLLEGRTYLAAA
jgi:hypothetical protein